MTIVLMAGGIRMAALNLYHQSDEHGRKHTAATLTLFILLLVAAGTLLTVAFAPQLARILGISDAGLLGFGIFAVMLEMLAATPFALMQARIESVLFVSANLIVLVSRLVLVIVAVVVLHAGVWGILIASAIVSVTFGGALTFRECLRSSFRPDLGKLREVAAFALPFVPTGICFFVLNNGDRFFLLRHSGPEEVGLYALGAKLAAVVVLAIEPLGRVWSSEMYRAFERPDARAVVGPRGDADAFGPGLCRAGPVHLQGHDHPRHDAAGLFPRRLRRQRPGLGAVLLHDREFHGGPALRPPADRDQARDCPGPSPPSRCFTCSSSTGSGWWARRWRRWPDSCSMPASLISVRSGSSASTTNSAAWRRCC